MAFRRRTSSALEKARVRSANLKSIDPNLDFGDGLSVAKLDADGDTLAKALEVYNTKLASLDKLNNELKRQEAGLNDMAGRLLAMVGAKWGKNSDEYESAGGTKPSEAKSPPESPDVKQTGDQDPPPPPLTPPAA